MLGDLPPGEEVQMFLSSFPSARNRTDLGRWSAELTLRWGFARFRAVISPRVVYRYGDGLARIVHQPDGRHRFKSSRPTAFSIASRASLVGSEKSRTISQRSHQARQLDLESRRRRTPVR